MLMALIPCALYAETPERQNWNDRMKLSGDVAQVIIRECDATMEGDALVANEEKSCTTYIFDENGNVVKRINHINQTYEYRYEGELLMRMTKYDEQGNEVEFEEYSYNDAGKVLSIKSYYSDELSSESTFEYDEQNQLIIRTDNDKMMGRIKTYYEYDDKGQLISTHSSSPEMPAMGQNYTYDDKGRLSTRADYMEFFGLCTIELEYDENDNVTSMIYIMDETSSSMTYYTYDEHNNLTSIKSYNFEGDVDKDVRYEYRYDEHNNAVEIVEYNNGTIRVTTYEITYR
jgi:YD repeat-containing protein